MNAGKFLYEFLDDSTVPGGWQHTIFLPSVLLHSGHEEDD